ncbi:MAG: cache domain-containing protein [Isosphaeraceae bacterium]
MPCAKSLARCLRAFRESRIAFQVAVWMSLTSMLPLVLVSFVAHRGAVESLRRMTLTHLSAIAESRANAIDAYLRERREDMAVLARNPEILAAMERFDRATDGGGANPSEAGEVDRRLRPYLSVFKDEYNYENITLISPAGVVVFSLDEGEDCGSAGAAGLRQGSALAEVFDRARTLLETDLSDYEPTGASAKPAAFIAAPLFKEGTFVGVITARLGNQKVEALTRDYAGLGETGEVIIASRRGDRILFLTSTRHDPNAAFARTLPYNEEFPLPIQQALSGRDGSVLARDYRGEMVFAVWKYLPSLRCGLVVKMDAHEVLAPAVALRNQSLGLVGGSVLLLALISSSIAGLIADPVAHLVAGVHRVRAQILAERVQETGPHELAVLGREFNAMAVALQASYRALA